eukprot:3940378-Rhodomonas_salina.1
MLLRLVLGPTNPLRRNALGCTAAPSLFVYAPTPGSPMLLRPCTLLRVTPMLLRLTPHVATPVVRAVRYCATAMCYALSGTALRLCATRSPVVREGMRGARRRIWQRRRARSSSASSRRLTRRAYGGIKAAAQSQTERLKAAEEAKARVPAYAIGLRMFYAMSGTDH